MPAKDRYHDVVVRALSAAGWTVTNEQFAVILVDRRLWIDIQAVKASERRAILIEVKGFERMPSPVEYLAEAVGKYVVYRAALDYLGNDTPLYLAVPVAAYDGILSEDIGQQAIAKASVSLVVFDPVKEEITRWIP